MLTAIAAPSQFLYLGQGAIPNSGLYVRPPRLYFVTTCKGHSYHGVIEQGRLLGHPTLQLIAEQHSATPVQVALAWVLRQQGLIAIPRASKPEHVQYNRAALDIKLTQNDLQLLDHAFPPPTKSVPLEIL